MHCPLILIYRCRYTLPVIVANFWCAYFFRSPGGRCTGGGYSFGHSIYGYPSRSRKWRKGDGVDRAELYGGVAANFHPPSKPAFLVPNAASARVDAESSG